MRTRSIAMAVVVVVVGLAAAAIATADRGHSPAARDAPDAPVAGPTPSTSPTHPTHPTHPTDPTDPAPTAADVPVLRPAPALEDLDGWLQADGIEALDDLGGRVVVVQFWTFGCSNCKATLPNLRGLRDAHRGRDDFGIVGVHYPEFAYEEDPDAILAAAGDLDVTWPIALDTRGTNFHAWQEGSRGFWPRTYVLDRDGNIRFDHVGEGRYDELNATVDALLGAAAVP